MARRSFTCHVLYETRGMATYFPVFPAFSRFFTVKRLRMRDAEYQYGSFPTGSWFIGGVLPFGDRSVKNRIRPLNLLPEGGGAPSRGFSVHLFFSFSNVCIAKLAINIITSSGVAFTFPIHKFMNFRLDRHKSSELLLWRARRTGTRFYTMREKTAICVSRKIRRIFRLITRVFHSRKFPALYTPIYVYRFNGYKYRLHLRYK